MNMTDRTRKEIDYLRLNVRTFRMPETMSTAAVLGNCQAESTSLSRFGITFTNSCLPTTRLKQNIVYLCTFLFCLSRCVQIAIVSVMYLCGFEHARFSKKTFSCIKTQVYHFRRIFIWRSICWHLGFVIEILW